MERVEEGTTPPTSVGGEKDWQLGDDWKTSGGSAALVAISLGLRRRKAAGGQVNHGDPSFLRQFGNSPTHLP